MGDELMADDREQEPLSRREKNLREAQQLKGEASWRRMREEFRNRRPSADQRVDADDERRRWAQRRQWWADRRAEKAEALGPHRIWDRRCAVVAVGILAMTAVGAGVMSWQVGVLDAQTVSAQQEKQQAQDQQQAEDQKVADLPSKTEVSQLLTTVDQRGRDIAQIQTDYLTVQVGESASRELQNRMQKQFSDTSWKNADFDVRTAWFGSDLGDHADGLTWHYSTAQYLDAHHIQAFWTLTNADGQLYAWAVSAYDSEAQVFDGLTVGKTTYGDRLLAQVHPNVSDNDDYRLLPGSVKGGDA